MPPKKVDAKMVAEAVTKALAEMQVSQPSTSASSGAGKKKKKKKKAKSAGTASIKFSRTELVASVVLKSKKANGNIKVHPDSAPILKKLGGAFERARWERSQFYWKPCVGAMYSGNIAMGVDWDLRNVASTRAQIAAYSPFQVLPLREDGEAKPLRMDAAKMKARQWYNYGDDQPAIACPCQLAWAAEGESDIAVGEIYWTYTVILDGPHP